MTTPIHFAHGNGFPALCYSQFLMALREQGFDVTYIDKVGHNPIFPVTENWEYLVDELIDSVTKQHQEPIVGLGHSLGGALTWLAAQKAPYLFQSVIMIDSPLPNRFKSIVIALAKKLGFIDSITPAGRTKGRKRHWSSRASLETYLKTRPLFAGFTQACLNDYIIYGVEEDERGFSLRFDPNIEYQIFKTIPHNLPSVAKPLDVPVYLVYGTQSKVSDKMDRNYLQSLKVKAIAVPGGHMVPMQKPKLLAEVIAGIVPS